MCVCFNVQMSISWIMKLNTSTGSCKCIFKVMLDDKSLFHTKFPLWLLYLDCATVHAKNTRFGNFLP